jgi:hypothetical protein
MTIEVCLYIFGADQPKATSTVVFFNQRWKYRSQGESFYWNVQGISQKFADL